VGEAAARLQKEAKFVSRDKQEGNQYHQPVRLTRAHGWTLSTSPRCSVSQYKTTRSEVGCTVLTKASDNRRLFGLCAGVPSCLGLGIFKLTSN
jgi:hypothetical protein